MTICPNPTARRAFTLVEVLISLVLAVILVVGIVTLLSFNFHYQNQQEIRAVAMDEMSRKMEDIRRQFIFKVPPDVIVVTDNRTPSNPYDDTTGTLQVRLFDRNGTELTAAPTGPDRIRVVLRVEWRGRGRFSKRTFHEELVSYMIP